MAPRQRTSSQLRILPPIDWQSDRSLVDCLDTMLCDERMTDIAFTFPTASGKDVTLNAHKLILAARSCVFEAMFYGSDAKKVRSIEVTDVKCLAFKAMLKYIYTDEVILSRDNALDVLRVSQQYNIPSLTSKCCDFLHPLLSAETVCDVMDEALSFNLRSMLLRCLVFVDQNATTVLNSEGFRKCSRAVFTNILQRNTLLVNEIDVYKAVVMWSESECRRQKIQATPENRRKVLGNDIFLVRIPCVTQQQFADCVVKDGLLDKDETLKIFMNYSSQSKDRGSPWPLKPRSPGLRIAERFSQFKETSFPSTMPITGRVVCICDADIICVGFTMKTLRFKVLFENYPIERVTGNAEITTDGKGRTTVGINQVLSAPSKRCDWNKLCTNGSNANIEFERPVFLEKDRLMEINLTLTFHSASGMPDSTFSECVGSLGRSPKQSFKCNDVTLKFLKPNDQLLFISGVLLTPY